MIQVVIIPVMLCLFTTYPSHVFRYDFEGKFKRIFVSYFVYIILINYSVWYINHIPEAFTEITDSLVCKSNLEIILLPISSSIFIYKLIQCRNYKILIVYKLLISSPDYFYIRIIFILREYSICLSRIPEMNRNTQRSIILHHLPNLNQANTNRTNIRTGLRIFIRLRVIGIIRIFRIEFWYIRITRRNCRRCST